MIDFRRLTPDRKDEYQAVLFAGSERGCEYSFANLLLWGHQKVAFLQDCVVFFSHFQGRSVYPYPIGGSSKKAAIEAILQDAQQRGISPEHFFFAPTGIPSTMSMTSTTLPI